MRNLFTVASRGYGHYLIFASAAALEVAVDYDTHTGHVAALPAAMATTVPVAIYLPSVWLMHIGPTDECRPIAIGFPGDRGARPRRVVHARAHSRHRFARRRSRRADGRRHAREPVPGAAAAVE
ncbi:hypothetical protein [Amycolatopsis coloradensis]|uniref:hypothetical protein n=1 Tax=Amycolatopsis coloradensis TaxID=76021 RepID=UPI0026C57757